MKNVHSIAIFWFAVGLTTGAIATEYIPFIFVVGIGVVIVVLILGHQISEFIKSQRRGVP